MLRKVITYITYPVLIAGIVLGLFGVAQVMADNISDTNKWAWGTNVGWINFNPTHGGVTVYSDHLEGYAWGENIGWIRLGSYDGGGSHTYANDAANTYGVNRNSTTGVLSGWAWGTNVGWINFAPTHGGGVSISDTGVFDGYAWGENVGWIHFKNTDPAYGPTLITLDSFTASGYDGHVLLEWQTASEVDNDGFNVWRSQAPDGSYTQLNAKLIPARGGPTTGARYSYDDEAVSNGVTYWYKLEDVDVYGTSTMHGPVSATPQRLQRLYLPLFLKRGDG
jgi:hypothetical protein